MGSYLARLIINIVAFLCKMCIRDSLAAAEKLAADGISAEVINMHTIKPLDEEAVIKAAAKTGKIVTVEEHSIIGGLGSAVCDVVAEKAPAKVMKIGIYDTYGESGPAVELIKKYGCLLYTARCV